MFVRVFARGPARSVPVHDISGLRNQSLIALAFRDLLPPLVQRIQKSLADIRLALAEVDVDDVGAHPAGDRHERARVPAAHLGDADPGRRIEPDPRILLFEPGENGALGLCPHARAFGPRQRPDAEVNDLALGAVRELDVVVLCRGPRRKGRNETERQEYADKSVLQTAGPRAVCHVTRPAAPRRTDISSKRPLSRKRACRQAFCQTKSLAALS